MLSWAMMIASAIGSNLELQMHVTSPQCLSHEKHTLSIVVVMSYALTRAADL